MLVGSLAACSANNHATSSSAPKPEAGVAVNPSAADDDAAALGPGTMPCNVDTTAAAKAVYAMDPTLGIADGPYPGDNVCIAAPDPALGMAFHYGPTTYDDPKEVSKFVLKPGEEVTDCMFFQSPNTSTIYFHEYHSRMRPFSHHMLLYVQPISGQVKTGGPTACNQGAQTRNLFGAQSPQADFTSVTGGNSPENKGLAAMLSPSQQVVDQAHFINPSAKPILREAWANIVFVDKSEVTEVGDPIFFLAGFGSTIPMGQTQTWTGSATVPANAASDFRLLIATGHYHAHTKKFSAWVTIGGQRQLLFEEYGQSTFATPYTEIAPEPKNWLFATTAVNTVDDPTNNVSGVGPGMNNTTVYMKPGDKVDWACEIENNDVSLNATNPLYNPGVNRDPSAFSVSIGGAGAPDGIAFANAVYSGEMCNMFGLYAPSLAPDTGCSWKGGQAGLLASGCP
jgi:hypothetical protein